MTVATCQGAGRTHRHRDIQQRSVLLGAVAVGDVEVDLGRLRVRAPVFSRKARIGHCRRLRARVIDGESRIGCAPAVAEILTVIVTGARTIQTELGIAAVVTLIGVVGVGTGHGLAGRHV